jgi:NAD(P)-dependent dehydrogenase (short-subunit alcohol dehydrogenase family)
MLKGKIAVITGGASGIGRGIVECCSRFGASVVIADKDEEKGLQVEKHINSNNGIAIYQKVDVTQEKNIQDMVNEVNNKFGRIDILVNNAGVAFFEKPLEKTSTEIWNKTIDTDLKSVFLCIKNIIPIMKKQNKGSIINISSNHIYSTLPDMSPYVAAKEGVIGLTRSLGLELGKYHIRVNAICPGFIKTPMYKFYLKEVNIPVHEADKRFRSLHPLGRMGKPEDIGNFVAFLGSDLSEFMTASYIIVDGGVSAKLFD